MQDTLLPSESLCHYVNELLCTTHLTERIEKIEVGIGIKDELGFSALTVMLPEKPQLYWKLFSSKDFKMCLSSSNNFRLFSPQATTSGYFHPCSKHWEKARTCQLKHDQNTWRKVYFQMIQMQAKRIKRRNVMVKNILRVSLRGLVVLTDTGALWVWTRKEHKTNMK